MIFDHDLISGAGSVTLIPVWFQLFISLRTRRLVVAVANVDLGAVLNTTAILRLALVPLLDTLHPPEVGQPSP